MNTVEQLLEERGIPSALGNAKNARDFDKRKEKIKKLLTEREYGEIPCKPAHMSVIEDEDRTLINFACGQAVLKHITFSFEHEGKTFSFPAISVIPKSEKKCPAFVYLGFESGEGGKYMPSEEIVERGFALFAFDYKSVTSDSNDFKDGIAKYLVKSRRKATAPGKIALWAWAAMRVMDYVETLGDVIDLENVAVIGHSRLGKTALLAGGFDARFKYVISNESGCAGAALERGKVGERYERIANVFPYWFCPSFNKDAAAGIELPFDQNFLISLSAPRHVIIGSAEEDIWADPTSEFLALASVNEIYALYKKRGLVHSGEVPAAKSILSEGDSSYYVRRGTHFLSRHDWNTYMDIIESKINN